MTRLACFVMLCLVSFWTVSAQAITSTLVADTKSGLVLASRNANVQQYPASLTKVMTLYLTFEAIENGLLKMDDKLPVSVHAAKQPKSKLYVKAGETITVREAILALIIKSANDVAVVLAEALAPSEEEFAKMMTQTARELGMKNTTFKNASGLHDPDQKTTAGDMAILTIAMVNHHPDYYKLFSRKSFYYKGKLIRTHNALVRNYKGAEGLKTGFISAVGYNIISTAKRDNHRLVSVVLGYNSTNARDRKARSLLDTGFKTIIKQKTLAGKLGKGKNNPLDKKALVAMPNKQSYLPIMEKSIKETKSYALALAKKPATDDRVLGVGYLDIDDFTATVQGDDEASWTIQVGAFGTEKIALEEARKALAILRMSDKSVKTPQADNFFRSRISGFDSKQSAELACRKLRGKKMQCMPIAPAI